MSNVLHPLDAGLMEVGAAPSGIPFPAPGWRIIRPWGSGYALQRDSGLRAIVDCSQKADGRWWVHLSVSRVSRCPTHAEMAICKRDFLGDRYAYSVWPPSEKYVNIHEYCLHIWALCDVGKGDVLPEFSDVVEGVGLSV